MGRYFADMVFNVSSGEELYHRQRVQIAAEMEGGFLWLMTVGGQAGEALNEEVERAAMAAALDLADVLEVAVPALDERARLRSSCLSA